MQKCKFGFFLLVIALFSTVKGISQDSVAVGGAITLQQCVDIAIKNNLQVRQSNLQMQTNGVYFKQAKDYLLPTINITANQGINFGRSLNPYTYTYTDDKFSSGSYGVNTGLNLFSGLQVQNSIRQNAFAYDASRMDWQQQKDVITLNVLLAYLQLLSAQDLLQITKAQAEVDLQQVQRLETMNKEGAVALLSTLYDLKGQYANDQVGIVTSINAVESAKINLFQLLNIPYRKDITYERIPMDLTAPEYGNSSDSIFQTAMNILPIIKSVDLKTKAFERALAVSRGAYYPTLTAYAGISTSYSSAATTQTPTTIFNDTSKSAYVTVISNNYPIISQQQNFSNQKIPFGDQFKNNRYEQVGLQLNIPILNYFRTRNNVKLAKINLKNAQYIAEATRNTLQQMVEQAYQNMISAYGQYKSYRDQVNAYGESFRSAEIRFNDGVITSVDYVIAKNNNDRAITNFTQARYNYIFRTKILDYYQGKLTW
jgi:outer membrane protein